MQISKKFEQGIEQHTYQRLDSDYKVNLFLGYNEDGKMSMVITEPGQVVKTKSSKMIDVQMSKREDGKIALTFDLLDNAYASMFTIFCKDMILVCEKAGKEMAISNAVVRWKYWLELFVKSDILNRDIAADLYTQCGTIRRILIASINTSKENKK